jgi:hypothetical protein
VHVMLPLSCIACWRLTSCFVLPSYEYSLSYVNSACIPFTMNAHILLGVRIDQSSIAHWEDCESLLLLSNVK